MPFSTSVDEIKSFRQERCLSQVELAGLLGVSSRKVEEWEAGRYLPPPVLRLTLLLLAARHEGVPLSTYELTALNEALDRLQTEAA